MTIVATSLYRNGHRNGGAAGDARIDCVRAPTEFVWIDLVDPTPDDLAVLQPVYGLSALAVVDVLRGASAPVFEDHGDHWFVGMPTAFSPTGMAGCDRIAVLTGPRYVITITYGLRRRGYRALLDGENERLRIDASAILYDHLSNAVAGYDRLVAALEEDVLSFARQSLGPPTTRESCQLASRLRLRLRSISQVFDKFGDVQDDIERHMVERTVDTPHALSIALSYRVRSLMQSADSLLKILDLAVDYRDCETAYGQRHRRTLPSVSMVISLVVLVSIQGAPTGPVGHSSVPFFAVASFAVRIGLLLCTSILLLNLPNGKSRP